MHTPGRAETLRYHAELYASDEQPPWLLRPARYILNAAARLSDRPALRALDLGAGIGRHAIPIASIPNHHVHAVDLLTTGLQKLAANAVDAQLPGSVSVETADVESYDFGQASWDLIVSCSCVEHVSNLNALKGVLGRIAAGTRENGVVVFMIATDVEEHTATGARPSLREFALSQGDAEAALQANFGIGWRVLDESTKVWEADEMRDKESYRVRCTCVQFTAQRLPPA